MVSDCRTGLEAPEAQDGGKMGRTEDAIFPDVADVVVFGGRHAYGSGILSLNKMKAQMFKISSQSEEDC